MSSWRNLSARNIIFFITSLAVITGVAFLTYKHQSSNKNQWQIEGDTNIVIEQFLARGTNSSEQFGHPKNQHQAPNARSFRSHTSCKYGNNQTCNAPSYDVYPNDMNDNVIALGGKSNQRETHLQRNVTFVRKLYSIITAYEPKRYLPNYFIHGQPSGREADYRRGHAVFVHNTKTGGTTIKNCLEVIAKQRHIPKGLMAYNDWKFGNKKYMALGQTKNQTIFVGTSTYRVCEVLKDRPCSYFTMVREPVSRIVSSFLYCKQVNSGCSSSSVNVPLKAWALKYAGKFFDILLSPFSSHLSRKDGHLFQQRSKGFRNFAQTMKSKYPTVIPGNRVSYRLDDVLRQALLDYCLENLENWFSVIGITEEFNVSLQLYEEVYALPFTKVFSVPKNRGKIISKMDASQIDDMKAELRSDPYIMEALYEDIKLYEKAREIMTKQKQTFLNH